MEQYLPHLPALSGYHADCWWLFVPPYGSRTWQRHNLKIHKYRNMFNKHIRRHGPYEMCI